MGDKRLKKIHFDFLGQTYEFLTDEPEEIVNEILDNIKKDVENIYNQASNMEPVHILLYLLLNEHLEKIELKKGLKKLISKASNISHKKE